MSAGSTEPLLGRRSFAEHARSPRSAPPPIRFLFVAPQVSLPAAFSGSLTITTLRFARVVATNSPEDSHLLVDVMLGTPTTACCDVRGHAEARATPPWWSRASRATNEQLGEAGASEHEEIRRENRRAHVGVEAASAFPHAPRETEDALQERDASFDASPKATQFVIDPLAPHHVGTASPRFLAKQTSDTPHSFSSARLSFEANAPSIAHLPWHVDRTAAAGGARAARSR